MSPTLTQPILYKVNVYNVFTQYIPDKKEQKKRRNAPLRTVHFSGRSQGIGQFSLYQFEGLSGTAALHIICNQAAKLC